MAISLASVLAAGSWLHASLAAAFLHQFLNRSEALALRVADLLADVAALEREATWLSAAWCVLRAVIVKGFLAAAACLGYAFHARRAVAKVAAERTAVTTCLWLQARPVASRRQLATLHRWVGLGNSTWAVERLPRVDLAGLAGAKMAEVVADVLLARECLVADEQAQVMTSRIGVAFPHGAANDLAAVPLALLVLIAHLLALEALAVLDGLRRRNLLGQLGWVVQQIARDEAPVLAALAFLLNLLSTRLAWAGVAFHLALVAATR